MPGGGARSGARRWCPEWCPEEVPGVVPRAATWEVPRGGAPRWCPEGTHVKKHNKTTSGHHLATLPTSSGHQVGAPIRGTTQSSCLQVRAPSGHLVEAPPEKTPANQVRSGHQVGAPSRGASEYFGPARVSQKRFPITSACPGTSAGSCGDLEKSCDALAKPLRNPCEALVEP